MKTLYIHGLDSHPKPSKIKILKELGLDVVALHINYREKLGIYETLKDTIKRKKIAFIVGSSLGGYLGNLLAEDLGLPCLLFNPAISYNGKVFYSVIPAIENSNCPNKYIVIGSKDDTINPKDSQSYFKKQERNGLNQQIKTLDHLGHKIDLKTFEEMANWAVTELKQSSS